jgi:hypothetical protein
MMREIKFRAWDKKVNEWVDGDSGITLAMVFTKGNTWYLCADGIIELMQFTGLKDKNGVEIFDGDLVKFPYYRKEIMLPIAWGVDGWWAKGEGWFKGLFWVADKCEVIGNIYENPELVEHD